MRAPRSSDALARLAAQGAENVLLPASLIHVAALAAQDVCSPHDVVRLDRILTMIARHPRSGEDPRALVVRGLYDAASGRCREALASHHRVIAARPDAARTYVLWRRIVMHASGSATG